MSITATKSCPYCSEEILFTAIKCKHCGSMLTEAPPTYTPTDPRTHVTLALANRFELLEEIGKGGMAVVYKARQKNLDRIVALKVIHQNLIHDSEFLERFHREARIASSLSHPNIVTIHDEGIENGVHFIAMEYLEGVDLHSLIKRKGKLKEEETIKIIIPIAEALDYAHSKQVIHRDIKSANIIITATGRAVLVDFGIAHAAAGTKLSQPGTVFGTPEYMSPEQADGKPIDHRSDLYSLGVVMYESLTGEVPFKGDNPITTIYKILNSTHSPIKLYSGNDEWINTVISKALTKDRAYRFSSGRELSETLKNRKKVWVDDKNDIKTESKLPPKTTYQPPQGSTIKMPGDISKPKEEKSKYKTAYNNKRSIYYTANDTSENWLFKITDLMIGGAILIVIIILIRMLSTNSTNETKELENLNNRSGISQSSENYSNSELNQLLERARNLSVNPSMLQDIINLYDLTKQILSISPNNAYADSYITQIRAWYINESNSAISKKNWSYAIKVLESGSNNLGDGYFTQKLNDIKQFQNQTEGQQRINNLLQQAENYINNYSWDNALESFENALSLDPGNGKARNGKTKVIEAIISRGDALYNNGNYYQALQQYQKALTLRPGDTRIQIKLTNAEEKSK